MRSQWALSNKQVFSCWPKVSRHTVAVRSSVDRAFHVAGPHTLNARRPRTVLVFWLSRVPLTEFLCVEICHISHWTVSNKNWRPVHHQATLTLTCTMFVAGGDSVVSSSRRSVWCKALLHFHWHVVSRMHICRSVLPSFIHYLYICTSCSSNITQYLLYVLISPSRLFIDRSYERYC